MLLDTRAALEAANKKVYIALDALELAKEDALQISQDLLSAKAEAQRTWDEVQANSANNEVATKQFVHPESNKLSGLQQAAALLGSIQNASEPLRQQLNAGLAAAIPADGGISSSGWGS